MTPGSYGSAAIILLTDGQTTAGPDPIEASKMAAERGVRVFTVGIGTVNGEILGAEGWSMRVRLDEEALKTIANVTKAEYFYAGTATDLTKIYKTLNSRLVLEQKRPKSPPCLPPREPSSRCSQACSPCSGSTGYFKSAAQSAAPTTRHRRLHATGQMSPWMSKKLPCASPKADKRWTWSF